MKDSTNIMLFILTVVFLTAIGVGIYENYENTKKAENECHPYALVFYHTGKDIIVCDSPNGRIVKPWLKEQEKK